MALMTCSPRDKFFKETEVLLPTFFLTPSTRIMSSCPLPKKGSNPILILTSPLLLGIQDSSCGVRMVTTGGVLSSLSIFSDGLFSVVMICLPTEGEWVR